ncbi:MAG: hypothetical protein HGB21_02260 [Nitrospirae bacterium]|nr:hypothetical protein [Nitrospirota bacterium]NTW65127.1 hypothetical protein [Nitrospirota bacterium]
MVTFTNILDTLLLLVIAASTTYVAVHYYRKDKAQANGDLYENRLRIYREIVQLLSTITRDGDISRQSLQEFRAKTQEGAFLFGQEITDYIDKLYAQASKLRATNDRLKSTDLPIGEERDGVTVENSKQLIWLADQLPRLKKLFEPYLGSDVVVRERQQEP